MKINVYLEERFVFFDGNYYSQIYDNNFWVRYLNVFDGVVVVARAKKIKKIEDIPNGYKVNDIKNVEFNMLPNYKGLFFSILSMPYLLVFILNVIRKSDKNILRLPGIISIVAGFFAVFFKKDFAVELVGDPYDVFGSGGVGGGFSKILQYIFTKFTKFGCYYAKSVAYVTKTKMQDRYPANSKAQTTHYSSIALPANLILKEKNIMNFNDGVFNLLMVGSMDQMYKGFDVMLAALHQIKPKYPNIVVHIIGGGKYRSKLDAMVLEFDLVNNVNFLGFLSRDSVFIEMDKSDLFVMPSRTEGLPRALIEAMARGLPAIGSNVGGIPELLSKNYIFESENVEQLAALLVRVIPNQDLRKAMSKENIAKSWDYEETELQSRREMFYKSLLTDLKEEL